MFGQDDFTEPPPDPTPLSSVDLGIVEGYTGDPGAIDYYGDPSLYAAAGNYGDPSLYEVPDLTTATRVSVADVLRGSYEPTPADMALAEQAIADIAATRDAGGDWQGAMSRWGSSLSEALRAALPAIVNRILGRSPSGGVVVARPEAAGVMNWTPLLVIGGILVVVTMLGAGSRGRATAGVPRALRQRRPHRRRSSGRRMRR